MVPPWNGPVVVGCCAVALLYLHVLRTLSSTWLVIHCVGARYCGGAFV